MNKRNFVRAICSAVVALSIAALAACNSGKEQPTGAEGKGRVNASSAFARYFGKVPSADKGTCYAFVIYFPSAKEPGKVVPFPFFTFDEGSLKKVALGKLIAGLELKSYQGELLQPFPAGTRVLDVAQVGDTVNVNFSKELAAAKLDPQSERGLVNAVALTMRQFTGVTKVAIKVEGAPSPLEKLAGGADESVVLPLAAPRLLSVTGMKEKGAKDVEEIDAFFDRPVEIKELTFSQGGRKIEGDVYQSVFDMSGVLKPKTPQPLSVGTPIVVHWKVVDKLGRAASGDGPLALEVKEH